MTFTSVCKSSTSPLRIILTSADLLCAWDERMGVYVPVRYLCAQYVAHDKRPARGESTTQQYLRNEMYVLLPCTPWYLCYIIVLFKSHGDVLILQFPSALVSYDT